MKLTNTQFYVVAGLLLIVIIAAMAGGGPKQIADTAKPDAPFGLKVGNQEEAEPSSLPADLKGELISIARLDGQPFMENNDPDSFSRGSVETSAFTDGTVWLYKLGDGRLWQARIGSGRGEQCGHALSSVEVVARFIETFRPGVTVADANLAPALAAALKEGRIEKIQVGHASFIAAGNCVQMLTFKDEDALPPA